MLYLNLTFDYELFFGENYGTYSDVLFNPTYELIDMLHKKDVSATFFADVCSVPIARKYNQRTYVDDFSTQLQYMKKSGQDVQLHIHPHWYNSEYKNGYWRFSDKGYRLHEHATEGDIDSIIVEGVKYLRDLLRPIDSEYECIAYRAGGFCLQPHEQIISKLYDNGIRVDSSIAPHLFAESEAHYYDYRHHLEKVNWHISNTAKWWCDSTAGKTLLEIPIATIDKSPMTYAFRRLFSPDSVKLNLGKKRGTYIGGKNDNINKFKAYYDFLTGYNAISMDLYVANQIYEQIKRFYQKFNCDDQSVALIGHPKLVNGKYIKNLSKFIDTIKDDSRFKIVSICDFYSMKEKNNEII